ncbi:PRTRC system ParB family protein [Aquimonas sp.]|jgi:ParB family chromosome partitioning protein|uniref:PRTRC system ParB family protein n=1 Tax=Aquimonas sp. TaxID=1872588 RepID=UPI0037BE9FA1
MSESVNTGAEILLNGQSDSTNRPDARIIPIAEIMVEAGHNPRKHFADAEFARLVESIAANGLLMPLLVRPAADGEGYLLVAGERRLRALRSLGITEAAVLVRHLSDQEARRAALLENTDRADLTVPEEAIAAAEHIAAFEGDYEAAARALGWGVQKLRHRVRLNCAIPAVMDAVMQGTILLGHAELLATLPEIDQAKVLANVITKNATVVALRSELNSYATPLATACFDRTEAGCTGCPYNSEVQRSLFDEHIDDAKCTNRACFGENTAKAIEAMKVALIEDFPVVALVSETPTHATVALVETGEQGVGSMQYAACRGCAFRGALIDDRPGATTGRVEQPRCFNTTCNAEKRTAYAALRTAPASGSSGGTHEADLEGSDAADASASTPRKPVASRKGAEGAAAVRAMPGAVMEQHAAVLRRAAVSEIKQNGQVVLGLALYALTRLIAAESGGSVGEISKLLGLKFLKRGHGKDTAQLPALMALDAAEQKRAIVDAAALLFDNEPTRSAPGGQLDRRALAALLVEQGQVNLMPHVRIDAEYLKTYTRAGLEALLDESGFTAWLKGQEEGEKRLRNLLGQKKDALIEQVLAAGFDFAGFVPSTLRTQARDWRKSA